MKIIDINDYVRLIPNTNAWLFVKYKDQIGKVIEINQIANIITCKVRWYDDNVCSYSPIQLELVDYTSKNNIKENIMEFKTGQPVLVRDTDKEHWEYGLFSHTDYNVDNRYPYHVNGVRYNFCIPYKGNESLVGTDKEYEPPHKFKRGDIVCFKDENDASWKVGIFHNYSGLPELPYNIYSYVYEDDNFYTFSYKYCKPFKVGE